MVNRINKVFEPLEQIIQLSNLSEVGAIRMPTIAEIKATFGKTGTADLVVGKHYGVAIKDEGDFVSVRFGSNGLTEIGSVPTAERNFSRKDEAFAFAEQIQNRVKEILDRHSLEIHQN